MTKVKINLQKALEDELGGDTTHIPATVEIGELMEFSGIGEHEVDIHDLLAEHKKIAIVWCVEDVKEVRPDLSDEQCWEVLKYADRKHDATVGINWDVLEMVAADLFCTRNYVKR